jgi:phosphohistidine swiveling domain-containing protein
VCRQAGSPWTTTAVGGVTGGRVSLWQRLVGGSGGRVDAALLSRRTTRFRQLLRSYSALLGLLEDAAEKQAGEYVLDRQYVVELADKLTEIVDAVAFDLNVLTGERDLEIYDVLESKTRELRRIFSDDLGGGPTSGGERRTPAGAAEAATVGSSALAAALARHPVAYRQSGHVACRGVAAGTVHRLTGGQSPAEIPAGRVLVAAALVPDDTMVATLREAAAILLGGGSPTSPVASLARELRIPAIVGAGGICEALHDGEAVTVDADDNTVYRGIVQELLDYYAAESIAVDEEPEYRLLRRVRRAVFPLTLPPASAPELARCTTLHDLVFLAHARGGDAIAAVVGEQGRRLGPANGSEHGDIRVVGLVAAREDGGGSVMPAGESPHPLAALLEGAHGHGSPPPLHGAVAAVKEEQALVVMSRPFGFDLVDAVGCDAATLNHIYCRFDGRFAADDRDHRRGALVAGALERLGFVAQAAGGQATGWLCGLTASDTEHRLRLLGSLVARLESWRGMESSATPLAAAVDALVAQCGQVGG